MPIPTAPIGSIPRPSSLIEGIQAAAEGRIGADELEALYADAVRETVESFEATGSPVITDDTSTARETAFANIRARVEGTDLAARQLGA